MNEEPIEVQIWKLAKKFVKLHPSYVKCFENDYDEYLSNINLYALKGKDSYDPEKGSLGTWCYRVFRNFIYMTFRKKRIKTISLNNFIDENDRTELQEVIAENDDKNDICELLDIKINCDKIIPHMSKELYSHFFENKSISDLAREYETSTQNIYKKLSKELFQLKKFMETKNSNYLTIENRAINKKKKENYIKIHKCSIRTYYKRKAEGKL